MPDKVIFLSVKPQYADMIFEGVKSVELRRVKPKYIERGSLVLLYASSPVKSIVGAFSVDTVVQESLENLWNMVKNESGISRKKYIEYFKGVKKGVGIFINEYWKLPQPISLDHIKQKKLSFYPPQSFMYTTVKEMLGIHVETLEILKTKYNNSMN